MSWFRSSHFPFQTLVGLVAAVIAAALAPPAASADGGPPALPAEPPLAEDAAAPQQPALPPAPGRIGHLRRDERGRIVPDGPPLPADRGAVGAGTPSPPPAIGGVPRSHRYRPAAPPLGFHDPHTLTTAQDRWRHEMEAKRRQLAVDKILREQAKAKRAGAPVDSRGLTPRESALIEELERIDREVRKHEMAHYFTGQPYAALPEYWFVTGPLGRKFAISGLTRMDATPIEGDSPATILKLKQLRRAALAPRDPSDEDHRLVAEIDRLIAALRLQLRESRR